jgi:DNA-binding NarL/FixJ family response regulator
VGAIALGKAKNKKAEEEEHSPIHALTDRERQILQLVDLSLSNKQIARHLGIEVATAKNHVHNILQKLHVHRRIDASSWYRQGGFHLQLET